MLMLCAVAASPLLFTFGAPGTRGAALRGSSEAAETYAAFHESTAEMEEQPAAAASSVLGFAAALGLVAGILLAPQAANAGTTKLGASGGMGTALSFTEVEEPGTREYDAKTQEEIERNKAAFKRAEAQETKEQRVARQMAKIKKIANYELESTGRGASAGVVVQ